jgi:hypothetical protein
MQFTAPSQGAGMQASISSGCRNVMAVQGEWDTHSSALGLQTKHFVFYEEASRQDTLV